MKKKNLDEEKIQKGSEIFPIIFISLRLLLPPDDFALVSTSATEAHYSLYIHFLFHLVPISSLLPSLITIR
jgi:hypothetical protein